MSSAAYADVQTTDSHIDSDVSIQNYTYERLLEYWTMVYTLGLLAGVAGSEQEQEAARQAVLRAVEDVAVESVSLWNAAKTAADDYSVPFVGAGLLQRKRLELIAKQNVASWFGRDAGFADDIENLDRRIRDSVAVDVNQVSQASKYAKAGLEELTTNTVLPDYEADTSWEDRSIARTQATVDARQAKVGAALDKIWNAIQDAALQRYNQFLSDWDKGGLDYALGTLGVDGAFLAVEAAITAAAAALTAGAGAVALRVSVKVVSEVSNVAGKAAKAAGKAAAKGAGKAAKGAGRGARRLAVTFKRAGGGAGKSGSFQVSEAAVVRHAKEHDGFGDDHAGVPRSSHENRKNPGGPAGASDPPGVRRAPDGEAMVQDPKTGQWKPVSQVSNNAKGNFGEVMADRYMAEQGYEKIDGPMAQMGDKGHQGIDGVYYKRGGDPAYVVADAKYGSAGLGTLKDGTRQMSPSWIEARLTNSVSRAIAADIDDIGYKPLILRVDKHGLVNREDLSNKNWR